MSIWRSLLAFVAVVAFASTALAHGVDDPTRIFLEQVTGPEIVPFVYIGAKHMVTGYDHILFLVGVIFFLYSGRDVLVYVSFFTIGHRRLSMRDRIELFAHVCQAIQHAHQKGIIHRDIKPNNVLIAEHDGTPLPKVIDFGIAKATGAEAAQKTMLTEQHQIIGTPEYMSPDQVGGASHDIDTRAAARRDSAWRMSSSARAAQSDACASTACHVVNATRPGEPPAVRSQIVTAIQSTDDPE